MFKQIKAFDNRIEIVSKKLNDNGYLVIECNFARTGIQERYGVEISPEFEALKLYKEYRSPDEIFKDEVLENFRHVVITNDHPQELLTSSNTKYHSVGFVSSKVEVIDGSHLKCVLTIYDQETIEDIQNGKVELSAGYLYSIIMVENEDYDYIQTDIKPNHIAIVQAGRCGSSCSIALDSDSKPNKGKDMKQIVFKRKLPDGSEKIILEIEVEDDKAEATQTLADSFFEISANMIEVEPALDEDEIKADDEDEIKAKDEEIEALTDEVKAKDEEIAKLQAEADTNKDVVASDAQISALAHDMAGVIVVAQSLGLDTKSKKICDLKKEVIKKVNPDLALDKKPEAYIGFAFDNVATQLKNADASFLRGLDLEAQKVFDAKDKEANIAQDIFKSKFGGN